MTQNPDPPILSYQSPKPALPPKTPEERRWLYGRLFYLATLAVLFFLIAFQLGPKRILFGKFTSLTPTDFTPIVQRDCVPVVRAIMEYQRDHPGDLPPLPPDLDALGFTYHGDALFGSEYSKLDRTYIGTHRITYNFTPGPQVWRVAGPFANGVIPVPPIVIAPSTKPAAK